ncbi:MAG: hypothetical protein IE909_19290 [Campylobacterales bacterium]|nr:hypothetical protein [Campylobacterales bacterium]
MGLIINALSWIGSAIFWVVKKFFPKLVKKFGISAVGFGIQKAISILLITVVIAFWTAFIVFLNQSLTLFYDFLEILNNPTTSTTLNQQSSEILTCFFALLNVSGVTSGFNSGFAVTLGILIFLFTHVLYQTALQVLSLVSDQIHKMLKSAY